MHRQDANVTVVRQSNGDRAVAFLHGFSGNRDDTWDKFPTLLGTQIPDWDIFTIGYATTLLPDVVGVWSADPDLPILATMLRTQLAIAPFVRYKSLTLIAHSMGGLVVQRALLDDSALDARVRHLMLFGTPSGGLRKAGWLQFWKRQLNNMAEGSRFITDLRRDWTTRFGKKPPFDLVVVAGANDQFVPPNSSLEPFSPACQRVVAGDHLSIVKPAGADAPSLALVVATLKTGTAPQPDAVDRLALASERATPGAASLVASLEAGDRKLTVKEIVSSALALERAGKRQEAIELLERHRRLGTDVQGTLGGRMKRLWLLSEDTDYAARALELYQGALDQALASKDNEQIYYLAINVAFFKFVVYDQPEAARRMADLAVQHAQLASESVWTVATLAEASLYFGRLDQAVALYAKLLRMNTEPWQQASAALQAGRIAGKLKNLVLAEQLEALFTPGAAGSTASS
jgi:pimeloyl-ACP methyl ester carboxylesterase